MLSLARAFSMFIEILIWAIIIRSLFSFIFRDRNRLVDLLINFTNPVLVPIRNLMNKLNINTGMVDFSPVVAILVLNLVRTLVIGMLI